MSPRRYVMENRARTADDTRRRIVEATYALHAERAIADTTMKDIAERADVGLGTVYHHFPTYNDVVRACGAHTFVLADPPTQAIFAGARSLDERIMRLAEALFAFYDRCPGIGKARSDQHRFAALRDFMEQWDAAFAGLVGEALRPAADREGLALVVGALLDFDVHARLAASGFGTSDAAQLMANMLMDWIKKGRGGTRTMVKTRRRR